MWLLNILTRRVRVIEYSNIMGPSVWEAKGRGISVKTYNGEFPCFAKEIIHEIADRANSDKLDWSLFADKKYAHKYMGELYKLMREGVEVKDLPNDIWMNMNPAGNPSARMDQRMDLLEGRKFYHIMIPISFDTIGKWWKKLRRSI